MHHNPSLQATPQPGKSRKQSRTPPARSRWRNKPGKPERRDPLGALGFLLPSLLGTVVFVLIPLADALRRSFFASMGGSFTGVDAYLRVFQNKAFQLAAANTGRFVLVCIPLLMVVSFLLALAVFSVTDNLGLVKTSFLLPLAIPAASMVALWELLFNRHGILNGITGLEVNWLDSPTAFWVLVATYLWKNCGYNMVLWLAGLYGISPNLYEAAKVDGAGAFQRLRYVTLPGLKPYLFTITALSLLNSFKVFREAYLLGGNYPHESIYMLQHLFNNWFTNLDIDKLCAAAMLLAGVLFALIFILSKIFREDEA